MLVWRFGIWIFSRRVDFEARHIYTALAVDLLLTEREKAWPQHVQSCNMASDVTTQPPREVKNSYIQYNHPANENELKWIQIFRNIDSRMLKWMLFNPECIFIHLCELHGAYLYAFQSKNNISFFCALWILFNS